MIDPKDFASDALPTQSATGGDVPEPQSSTPEGPQISLPLAERMLTARLKCKLSLQMLARNLNCSVAYLSEIETGRRVVPNESFLQGFAVMVYATPSDLRDWVRLYHGQDVFVPGEVPPEPTSIKVNSYSKAELIEALGDPERFQGGNDFVLEEVEAIAMAVYACARDLVEASPRIKPEVIKLLILMMRLKGNTLSLWFSVQGLDFSMEIIEELQTDNPQYSLPERTLVIANQIITVLVKVTLAPDGTPVYASKPKVDPEPSPSNDGTELPKS